MSRKSILKIRSAIIILIIDGKNYKDLVIYCTIYVLSKSIKMLSVHYHELIGKVEEHEGKKYLMVNNYKRDKLLGKIKKIDIEKLDDSKIVTDNKLPNDITLKKCWDINDMCYER